MKMDLAISGKPALDAFVCDANKALHFRLVRTVDGLESDDVSGVQAEFPPEMTHQIYGEQENIFGYRDLRVDMVMTAGSLKAFVKMSSEETFPSNDDVEVDRVLPPLVELLAPGQLANTKDDFIRALHEEDKKFKPFGEKIDAWTVQAENNEEHHYEVYACDVSMPGFRDYHARLQPWIMFYIDAASYIDVDDDHWHYFLLFERYSDNGDARFAIAGYITVYQYYAYPLNVRPRISQMLVLPPFQRQGLGSKLLESVCRSFWGMKEVVDITVEDPSDDFVRLRDFVDARNCMKLSTFKSESVRKGFSLEMAKEANERYKICKRQARRVYEIIRLHYTNRNDSADYKAYRVVVKTRLNLPYQKEEHQLAKLKKVLKPEEFAAATVNITNREQRIENLQTQYRDLEEHYLRVLERITDE